MSVAVVTSLVDEEDQRISHTMVVMRLITAERKIIKNVCINPVPTVV